MKNEVKAVKNIQMRRCVACRESKYKSELLRVVRTLEGNFEIDFTGKAQGRGAYICKSKQCAVNAKKRRNFDKSFKSKVPAEIYESICAVTAENND